MKNRLALFLSLPVAACCVLSAPAARAATNETAPSFTYSSADTNNPAFAAWQKQFGPSHESRMKWWREAKFGMFIHWGIYSVPAGVYKGEQSKHIGEWIMRDYNIPVAEYAGYAKEFNPTNFNADQWVSIAKNAGMKYIVITAKHHDGFAMFCSKASDYNICDATPFKRDPLQELAAACRKQGIKLGFYYSEAQDWHNPGGAAANKHPEADIDPQHHWDKAQSGSMDDYIEKVAVPQVKELLSDYGRGVPAVLWFDTPVSMTPERAEKFLPLLKLQPKLIINNRLDSKKSIGDYQTPEQKIPTNGLRGDWETCMTMNGTWGYKSFDHNWKSTELLVRNLVDIASKGGNYLLNVGPTDKGEIPEPSIERLKEIGAWMEVNGDAIYGTTRSPLKSQPAWGRVTRKGNTLYLHVFNWPDDGKLALAGLKNKISSAKLLATGAKLKAVSEDGTVTVSIPESAPDKISSTIALKLKGQPEVE